MGNTISIPYNLRDENQLSLLEVIDNKQQMQQLKELNEFRSKNLLSRKKSSVFPETVLFEKTPQ
jgi:hypothetical protein